MRARKKNNNAWIWMFHANCVIHSINKTHILNVDVRDIKLDDNTFVYIMSFWFITDIRFLAVILTFSILATVLLLHHCVAIGVVKIHPVFVTYDDMWFNLHLTSVRKKVVMWSCVSAKEKALALASICRFLCQLAFLLSPQIIIRVSTPAPNVRSAYGLCKLFAGFQ